MYQDYFPNSANDKEDMTIFYRFTTYLQKTVVSRRAKYLKKMLKITQNENVMDVSLMEDTAKIKFADLSIEYELENIDAWDTVKRALRCLTDREREVLLCSCFLDMTDQEIANKLHASRTGVLYTRHQALAKLEIYMKENRNG